MSGVSARTGRNGKVVVDDELVARITQWSLNSAAGESAWGDSDSAGYTNRKAARLDGTGSFGGKFDSSDAAYDLFIAGDIVELVLWEETPDYWAFPSALIVNFQVTYDMDTKEVVGWTSYFGADGIFYYPGQSGAPSHTLPA
jgi:hypothetical protein